MQLNKAKRYIDNHEVISFDIFDTLLLRPYLRPTDLFVHLEKISQLPNFAQRRITAERVAREKHNDLEDINLDEIYAELSGKDVALKEQELALERQTLSPNPFIQTLFNYAKEHGKRIIITSDMYLPEAFLTQVLNEKGFHGFEKLYVSNGPRKLKGSGTLYHYIQQELQLDPSRILHIGDNKRSDVRRAQKAGWHALYYPAQQTLFFKKYPRFKKFWQEHPSFEASVILGVLILYHFSSSNKPYFENFGYEIGGPTAYGFARWIEKEAVRSNVESLFFVARDGYTLHKVFHTFDNPHIKSAYIYALRFLNNIYRLDYRPTARIDMEIILKYFADKLPQPNPFSSTDKLTKEQMHQLIQENLSTLLPLAKQELAHYRQYLSAYYKPNQMIGVVDTITGFFSSQKLIEAAVGIEQVIGYYWTVWPSDISAQHRFESFLDLKKGDRYQTLTYCWPLIEFILTAPQPPIKTLSAQGVPSYGDYISPQEQARIASYEKVSGGMENFAKDIKRIFGGKDIFLTQKFLIQWLNWFLLHPTKTDRKEMAKIFHASGSDHKEYEPLLSYLPSIKQIASNLKQYITFAKQVFWKTPFQFCLTCLLSPAATEHPSAHERILYFFPRSRKQYFRKSFSLKNQTFTIIWGRRNAK